MSGEIQTFTFEGHYTESSDAGSRCDVERAYTREQALSLAAIQMIEDNGWDRDRFEEVIEDGSISSLAELYEEEIHIDSEWAGLKGRACPNCTSHGGRDTLLEHGAGTIHECRSCYFQWVPLGIRVDAGAPTREQIDAEIAKQWAEFISEGED